MANGWESYFHNLPPLSMDPSTMRKTSESEDLSQHIEDFIEQHGFPDAVDSHEAPSTNADPNTNYYSNPCTGNSSLDCVYQTYYKETAWQADGGQTEKDYLPGCGNGDIDFSADGISPPESFPVSFDTDLQGFKQDCGILATSFLEAYSDVSSCSDSGVSETRPSCKFMSSNLVSEPKTSDSSECLLTDSENMAIATEVPCTDMPETSKKSAENFVECSQDKMSSPNNSLISTNESSTVDEGVKYNDETKPEEMAATAPDNITFDNEKGCVDEIKLQDKNDIPKEEGKESDTLENESVVEQALLNPNSTDGQEKCMETNCHQNTELNTSKSLDSCSLEECTNTLNRDIHEFESCSQLSENACSETVAKDKICSSPAPLSGDLLSDDSGNNEQNVASNSEECLEPDVTSKDTNNSQEMYEAEESSAILPHSSCNGPGVTSNIFSVVCENGDTACEVDSSSQPNGNIAGINPCLEKELTVTGIDSPKENATTASSPDDHQTQCHSSVALETENQTGEPAKNEREPSEELGTSVEKPHVLDPPYGEPLSGEDSCSSDDMKLGTSQFEDPDLAISDSNEPSHSEPLQLNSKTERLRNLQPVVILRTGSMNGMSDSYICGSCQYTTLTVDQLIEHHHCCHLVHNVKNAKTGNHYQKNRQSEKLLCGVTKENTQPPPDSIEEKERKHHGRHRCLKCRLTFSKMNHYVRHMRTHTGKTPFQCNGCGSYFSQSCSLKRHLRVPGRCKTLQSAVTNSDDTISETKPSQPKEMVQNKPNANFSNCFVKLVDISKTHLWKSIKTLPTSQRAKDAQTETILATSPSQSNLTSGDKKSQQDENETDGKYRCPLCPRLFKYSYNRTRHLRFCIKDSISANKKPGTYHCPLCHSKFTLSSNRYRHIYTLCFREFVKRFSKQKIMKPMPVMKEKNCENEQGTQSKENEPKILSEGTVQMVDRERRRVRKTPVAPKTMPRYKCNLCPAVFYHSSGRYRHKKKHELFKLTGKRFRYRNSVSTFSATSKKVETEETKDTLKSTEGNVHPSLNCNFCGKCFSTPDSLKKHERSHKGERPYRCLQCGKGFAKRAYLTNHLTIHQRRIQCTVCKKILPSISKLIQHRRLHLKKGQLKCPDCHLQFEQPTHFLKHLHDDKNGCKEQAALKHLQCFFCKEILNTAKALRKHCLTHLSESSSSQCPFCEFKSDSQRYLLCHMVKHTRARKPVSCPTCGKEFHRRLYYSLHIQRCQSAPAKPHQASQIMLSESKILETKTTETQTPETKTLETKKRKAFQCTYCPRDFTKKNRWKNHLNGHKENYLLLCQRCGQYWGRTKFSQHLKICIKMEPSTVPSSHDGDLSKKTSQETETVQKAPKVQSSEKQMLPFKCSHCPQKFRYRSLLLRHRVTHTGVQPYACARCGNRFRSQTKCLQHEAYCDAVSKEGQSKVEGDEAKQLSSMPSLREVRQKSQAEAEYKCKFCTKTFMKARNLRRHILTHNEVKPYRCKACDSCFSRYDHLKFHQIHCKGRRARLEVCIPKITLDDVGTGWQNRFRTAATEKEQTFDCQACSKSFTTSSNLARHNTLFHNTRLFKCTGCGAAYSHEKSLKEHKRKKRCGKGVKKIEPTKTTVSLPETRAFILQRLRPKMSSKYKYMCSYCPRAFEHHYQLSVHLRLHTGERPYACDGCGERFIRKDYVQRHLPKCSKILKQQKVLCDRCGGFFLLSKLEHHKQSCVSASSLSKPPASQSQQSTSHNPPKGFSCAYCSSRFLLFSQLQEHFLTSHKMETMGPPVSSAPLQHHLSKMTNIKEECLDGDSCKKPPTDGTNVICNLETALKSQGARSFSCPECKLSFISKAGLSGHLRTHKMEHPFSCRTCKRGFWNKSLLRSHYRKCRYENKSETDGTEQLEQPLKAEIDFALNDSVLVFGEGSKTTGTGVLQTNFSCKEEPLNEQTQNSEGSKVCDNSSKEKKPVQYQCSECDRSFTDGLMLISHLEDHGRQEQEKKRNTCSQCGRVFASQARLESHMKVHENRQFSCPDCSKIFDSLSELQMHRLCHDPSKPFPCRFCNQRFSTKPSLGAHYGKEHPAHVYTCSVCKKTYSAKKSLSRHFKKWHKNESRNRDSIALERSYAGQSTSETGTTRESDDEECNSSEDSDSDSAPYFPCHVCGKTFSTSESLEDHQRCHLGEKPHECAECGKCFFQASQLQQHQRMHKSEFQCQACGRGFVSLFALRKHKHTHGKSRPYRCSKCELSFTGPSQLAEHMSTHREENFPCDICNKVFLSKISRAEHRKSHLKTSDHLYSAVSKTNSAPPETKSLSHNELKYRCGVCNERFKDPEELSEHGCLAARERPFSCKVCDKHFLDPSHLKKHKTTHQRSWSSREYHCNYCNSRFFSSQQFLSHLKSHDVPANCNSDGKAKVPSHGFICPICHQRFATAVELMVHFPKHPAGPFECKICKLRFPTERKLQEHKSNHRTSATGLECKDCGKSFSGSEAFLEHHCSNQRHTALVNKYSHPPSKTSPATKQVQGEEEEIDVTGEDLYSCLVCSLQFPSKSSFLEHQNKQHSNDRPFQCRSCLKTFALRRYLRQHEKNYCLKNPPTTTAPEGNVHSHTQAATEQALTSPMRAQAIKDDGNYRCDMCYRSFQQLAQLKRHQESHVGQIVYECTECDKAFAFPDLLEKHQQFHAGSSQ